MTASGWGAAFGGASRSSMQRYEDALVGPLFEPWARLLLDSLGVAPAEAVLDVACGPGTVAVLAAAVREVVVRDAGFREVRVRRHVRPCVFPGGPEQLYGSLAASGIAADLDQLSDRQRKDLLQIVKDRADGLVIDGVFRSETAANIASGIRPA
ncbi:MAG: hypothetical protein ACRDUV_06990 [Pseudonocardiaceae bacterium]